MSERRQGGIPIEEKGVIGIGTGGGREPWRGGTQFLSSCILSLNIYSPVGTSLKELIVP